MTSTSSAPPQWWEVAGLATAWPAVENLAVGPWTARASDGFTYWANSVLVPSPPPLSSDASPVLVPSPEELIGAVEAFYAARRLPGRFRLCGPVGDLGEEGLVTALLGRGYRHRLEAEGQIWGSELRPLRASAPAERFGRVRIASEPTEDWLQRWWAWLGRPDSERSGAMELLSMLERHVGFAAHVNGADVLALAIGVVQGPWLELHDLLPALPDPGTSIGDSAAGAQGSARRVISALATWGIAHAARWAHTEVPSVQTATAALLEGIGFRPLAQVSYLEQG
ncbi:MAG: hypothetical protein ACKV2O_13230 [Acidimicrobiales bacterium]